MTDLAPEIRGYIASIEPIVERGLIRYRLKITSHGESSWRVYLRELKAGLRIGAFVVAKVVRSTQTGEERLIVDEISVPENARHLEPEDTVIEEVSGDGVTIVSGKRSGRMFSLPVMDQDVVKKIPRELPARVLALFLETSKGTRLISVVSEREHKIFLRTAELLRSIEKNEEEVERICGWRLNSMMI